MWQRRSEGERIGAEHRRASTIERHGFGRVAEDQRDKPCSSEAFGVSTHLTEVVRMIDRRQSDPLAARSRHERLDRQINGRIREAEPRIDADDGWRRPCQRRHCGTVDLAGAHL